VPLDSVKPKKRVLIVDDERAILKVLGIKLGISGYEVITASKGLEALQLIDQKRPDIMLLDVIMPGMDGFTVLKEVRSRTDLPVIVLSARPENGRIARGLGANDFLCKPFDLDDLIIDIQKLLN